MLPLGALSECCWPNRSATERILVLILASGLESSAGLPMSSPLSRSLLKLLRSDSSSRSTLDDARSPSFSEDLRVSAGFSPDGADEGEGFGEVFTADFSAAIGDGDGDGFGRVFALSCKSSSNGLSNPLRS